MDDGAVGLAGPFADIQLCLDQERIDIVPGELIENGASDHTATDDERTDSRDTRHHKPFRSGSQCELLKRDSSMIWAIV
jgi:hypothetical protein